MSASGVSLPVRMKSARIVTAQTLKDCEFHSENKLNILIFATLRSAFEDGHSLFQKYLLLMMNIEKKNSFLMVLIFVVALASLRT